MRVMIVGAGTGGLALAHGLVRAGVEVAVFERDGTEHEDAGGFRVGISPAGSRALKACVPPEVYDLFVATSARAPRCFNVIDERFAELVCLELEGEAADLADGEKNVIRKTLRRVLLTGLDDRVAFGKSFVDYADNPDGTVTVHFEDGTSATGNVLIGADGASSRVRRQRLPQARHEDTGIVSLGGKLPMTAQSRALITDRMFQGMSLIMAPRGFGAILHSIEFAASRGDPDFAARWPQFADAVAEDAIGWGLWGARQNVPGYSSALEPQAVVRLAQDLTRGWAPAMGELIGMTDLSTVQRLRIRTSVPPAPWESSNVTLLGDAVHTMTPGRGAGANTALRDAALLCGLLAEADRGARPLLQAIGAYEAEMLRYSGEAVIKSRQQMNAGDAIHRPILGGMQLAAMRTGMRAVNRMPPVKRRISRNIMRVRGEN